MLTNHSFISDGLRSRHLSVTNKSEIILDSKQHKESLRCFFPRTCQLIKKHTEAENQQIGKLSKRSRSWKKAWLVNILFKLVFWQLHFEQAVICIRHLLLNLWHRITRNDPTWNQNMDFYQRVYLPLLIQAWNTENEIFQIKDCRSTQK